MSARSYAQLYHVLTLYFTLLSIIIREGGGLVASVRADELRVSSSSPGQFRVLVMDRPIVFNVEKRDS